MKLWIVSSLSLNMLDLGEPWRLEIMPIPEDSQVPVVIDLAKVRGLEVSPAIGHEDTAGLLERRFQGTGLEGLYPLYRKRQHIKLEPGDELIVFQYNGPRLPEHATALPEGATLTPVWVRVL